MSWLDHLPWPILILACLTLGLAPFARLVRFVPCPFGWRLTGGAKVTI